MVPVSLTKSTLSFKTNMQKSRFARIGFFVAKNLALIKHLIKLSIKTKKCYNYKNITFFERKYEEKNILCKKTFVADCIFINRIINLRKFGTSRKHAVDK